MTVRDTELFAIYEGCLGLIKAVHPPNYQKEKELFDSRNKPFIAVGSQKDNNGKPSYEKGSVVVVPVIGAMERYSYSGWFSFSRGTEDIRAELLSLEKDPNVAGIILQMDSGGGTVDGTDELSRTVKNLKKPVYGLVTGMAASACYWLASQCKEVVATSNNTVIGSIGCFTVHADVKDYFAKEGINVEVIRAKVSPKKVLGHPYEPLSDEAKAALQDSMAGPMHNFIKAVKSGRGDKLAADADIFNGSVYNADEAKKLGLIDAVMLPEQFYNYVYKAVNTQQQKGNNKSNMFNWLKTKVEEVPAEDIVMTPQQQMAVNKAIQEKDQRISDQEKENTDLKASISSLQSQLDTLKADKAKADNDNTAELSRLKAENDTLKAANTDLTGTIEVLKAEVTVTQESVTAAQAETESTKTKYASLVEQYNTLAELHGKEKKVAEGVSTDTTKKEEQPKKSWAALILGN